MSRGKRSASWAGKSRGQPPENGCWQECVSTLVLDTEPTPTAPSQTWICFAERCLSSVSLTTLAWFSLWEPAWMTPVSLPLSRSTYQEAPCSPSFMNRRGIGSGGPYAPWSQHEEHLCAIPRALAFWHLSVLTCAAFKHSWSFMNNSYISRSKIKWFLHRKPKVTDSRTLSG